MKKPKVVQIEECMAFPEVHDEAVEARDYLTSVEKVDCDDELELEDDLDEISYSGAVPEINIQRFQRHRNDHS